MSLYNMLFGRNPSADILLAMLGITQADVPRFRDCFLDDKNHIVIHTRTGGGNRDDYETENDALTEVPGYISNSDDDFDCTYADFLYAIPEKFSVACELLRDMGAQRDPGAAWQDLFAKLNDPSRKDDPQVQATINTMKPVMEKLAAALEGKGPSTIEV